MPDREKVITGLNDIGGFIAGRVGFEQARNFLRTIDEANAMLKEQQQQIWELQDQVEYLEDKRKEHEAVYPSWQNGKMYCGHCGSKFPPRVMMRFCHRCGVPIKLKVNDIV